MKMKKSELIDLINQVITDRDKVQQVKDFRKSVRDDLEAPLKRFYEDLGFLISSSNLPYEMIIGALHTKAHSYTKQYLNHEFEEGE